METELTVEDFRFELPAASIAQAPAARREDARLMLLPRDGASDLGHRRISELAALLRGDELLVFNDTRVVPARIRAHKPTGGRVELLALGESGRERRFFAMARSSKPLRPGLTLVLDDGREGPLVEEALGGGRYLLGLPTSAVDLWSWLEGCGELPLPPYIERPEGPRPDDVERYQTVFARRDGAVAAPTAGLHFSTALLAQIASRGCEAAHVTLHVGPGTFRPVRVERLDEHEMHAERYHIDETAALKIREARAAGRPVLAIGTTVVRTLEASALAHAGEVVAETAETDIFIRPGYRFAVVDQLMTNFHLPGSTLLMLVSAFAERQRVLDAYNEAVARGYRFYSYGDGMLIR